MTGRLFGLDSSRKTFEFKCADCDEIHRGSPSFGYVRPVYYFDVPESERAARIKISDDFCRIEPAAGSDNPPIYAIRATLDIPIEGVDEPFCWGVWVTQSEESFKRYVETFGDDQTGMGSFGWLAVSMSYYDRTDSSEPFENLSCDVNWGPAGKRPKVIIQACDHPLFIDQSQGISWEKTVEIARLVMHG